MFDSASEFARELGVDKKTVINYIKQDKIHAYRYKNKKLYKIPENEKYKIKYLKKPYPKWQKQWTSAEENMLRYSPHLSSKELSDIIKRTAGSIRVHKCIMRKRGTL